MHFIVFFLELCFNRPYNLGKYNLKTHKGLSSQLISILQKKLVV